MNRSRRIRCKTCDKDFDYTKKRRGRWRKHCFDCRPSKSANAYTKPRPFPWGDLPEGWWIANSGNAARHYGPWFISVWERGGYFGWNIPSSPDGHPYMTDIEATAANVGQALARVERRAATVIRTWSIH